MLWDSPATIALTARAPASRLADTGTNFLVVPQQVADNAATILNPQMEKLSGKCSSNSTYQAKILGCLIPALKFLIHFAKMFFLCVRGTR